MRAFNVRTAPVSASAWSQVGARLGVQVDARVAVRAVLGLAWATTVIFLATHNLETYPTTWFDEGSHLHVPKALVQSGVYADRSSEGFRYFGPTTGVGPTVLLPIAAAFEIAGIGLLPARLVMVGYLVLAVIASFVLARRLHDERTAWIASLLLVAVPGVNLLYLGRQVLGEVPALLFFLLATLAWCRSIDRAQHGWGDVVLAGALFGLTALTKSQFALILVATFAATFVADRVHYRVLRRRHVLVPLGCVVLAAGLGQLFPLLPLLGTGEFFTTLALAREASTGAIFVFSPARALSALKFLVSPEVFAYWALPGLAYAVALARPRTGRGMQQAFLLLFAASGLAWFAFGSIGWPRYAFPALAVCTLFVARLLSDLIGDVATGRGAAPAGRARGLAVAGVVAVMVTSMLAGHARTIVGTPDTSPRDMAAYLDATVARDTVIETWEPELGLLTDHAYHYPPSGWLDRAVRARWLGGAAEGAYDPFAYARPEYLLVGKFGKYAGIYAPLLGDARVVLLASFGEYDLYRVESRP